MSMLWLTCGCGQRMKVPLKALGTTRRCFRCGVPITVSQENTVPLELVGGVADPASIPREAPAPGEGTGLPQEQVGGREDTAKAAVDNGGSASTPAMPPALSAAAAAALAPSTRLRIGELLVNEGVITKEQLDKALDRQERKGGKVVENLIAMQVLDPRTFVNFLSRQPGTASIDLLNYTIPREVIELVPAEFALRHELLPIDKMGKQLTVGMACPLDSRTVNELVEMTGMKIRPLLVSMNDIRIALNRYYVQKERMTFDLDVPLPSASGGRRAPAPAPQKEVTLPKVESALTFEGVLSLVRDVTSLPALPETVVEVRSTMERPESTAEEVSAIIRKDPSLSAKLISLANSGAYGFSHHVDSVESAATLLGLREIYSVVLSSAVIDYFDKSRDFDYKRFWKRSLMCATAAKVIAKACGRKDVSALFTAGLLHDLGRAVLAETVPQRYGTLDQSLSDAALIAEESEAFGVAHPEVGYVLAATWRLPLGVCECIRFHHDFTKAQHNKDQVAIVALAALLTDTYGRITRQNVGAFAKQCKPVLQAVRLTDKQFIEVLAEASNAIRDLNKQEVAKVKGA